MVNSSGPKQMSDPKHEHKVLGPAHSGEFEPKARMGMDSPAEEKSESANERLKEMKPNWKLK